MEDSSGRYLEVAKIGSIEGQSLGNVYTLVFGESFSDKPKTCDRRHFKKFSMVKTTPISFGVGTGV